VDEAIARYEHLIAYLRQDREDAITLAAAQAQLLTVGAREGAA
jgi:hypothetical protein